MALLLNLDKSPDLILVCCLLCWLHVYSPPNFFVSDLVHSGLSYYSIREHSYLFIPRFADPLLRHRERLLRPSKVRRPNRCIHPRGAELGHVRVRLRGSDADQPIR